MIALEYDILDSSIALLGCIIKKGGSKATLMSSVLMNVTTASPAFVNKRHCQRRNRPCEIAIGGTATEVGGENGAGVLIAGRCKIHNTKTLTHSTLNS
jgi:hypothetical protein